MLYFKIQNYYLFGKLYALYDCDLEFKLMEGVMKKIRVLIVEKDNNLCKRIKWNLEVLSRSYSIITAKNSVQALTLLEKEYFDVLVTDISTGKIDGIGLIDIVNEKHIHVQTILIAPTESHKIAETENLRVFEYMTKPISNEALHITIIKAWLMNAAA